MGKCFDFGRDLPLEKDSVVQGEIRKGPYIDIFKVIPGSQMN